MPCILHETVTSKDCSWAIWGSEAYPHVLKDRNGVPAAASRVNITQSELSRVRYSMSGRSTFCFSPRSLGKPGRASSICLRVEYFREEIQVCVGNKEAHHC